MAIAIGTLLMYSAGPMFQVVHQDSAAHWLAVRLEPSNGAILSISDADALLAEAVSVAAPVGAPAVGRLVYLPAMVQPGAGYSELFLVSRYIVSSTTGGTVYAELRSTRTIGRYLAVVYTEINEYE